MKEKTKKVISVLAVAVILILGISALVYTYENVPDTYNGDMDVRELLEDPENNHVEDPDGIASIIVAENLSKTNAMNDVASIVFDFRGFDTLGESFILLTAIAGTFVIISTVKKKKKTEVKEETEDEV